MQLGMIGLGRMGASMVRRLQRAGHQCVAFDRSAESVKHVASEGAIAATSLDDLVKKLNQVLTDWDKAVAAADDAKIAKNASLIAHVGAHNAYHVGQILYVRKQEGVWNPDKGVK